MKCSFCTNPAESLTAKLCPECWGGIAPDMQAVLLEGRVLAELIREWGGMLNIDGSAYKKKDIEELMAKHPKPGAGPSNPDGDDVDYGKPGGDVPQWFPRTGRGAPPSRSQRSTALPPRAVRSSRRTASRCTWPQPEMPLAPRQAGHLSRPPRVDRSALGSARKPGRAREHT